MCSEMDVALRVWVPEHETSVIPFMEHMLREGVAPLSDLMQPKLDQAYGIHCIRVERVFHCVYPRGPIRAGALTGLRTHRHIASHVMRNVGAQRRDIPIPSFTCSICLEECSSTLQQRILPCMHKFHVACIERWLDTQTTCPECRTPVHS